MKASRLWYAFFVAFQNELNMFDFNKTPICNVFELTFPSFKDDRGVFTKVFQDSFWQSQGINFQLKESYFSLSAKDVIRGMHFQLPPFQHHKIVYCPQGSILDVAVDLRKDFPSYGHFFSTVLSAENHKGLFIPEGCAHGFKSLEDNSLTAYLVSSEYRKEADTGILWNSFGMEWACEKPIISERDKSFSAFQDFDSPF